MIICLYLYYYIHLKFKLKQISRHFKTRIIGSWNNSPFHFSRLDAWALSKKIHFSIQNVNQSVALEILKNSRSRLARKLASIVQITCVVEQIFASFLSAWKREPNRRQRPGGFDNPPRRFIPSTSYHPVLGKLSNWHNRLSQRARWEILRWIPLFACSRVYARINARMCALPRVLFRIGNS